MMNFLDIESLHSWRICEQRYILQQIRQAFDSFVYGWQLMYYTFLMLFCGNFQLLFSLKALSFAFNMHAFGV